MTSPHDNENNELEANTESFDNKNLLFDNSTPLKKRITRNLTLSVVLLITVFSLILLILSSIKISANAANLGNFSKSTAAIILPLSCLFLFIFFLCSINMMENSYKMTKDYDSIKEDSTKEPGATTKSTGIKTFMQRITDPIKYITELKITEDDISKNYEKTNNSCDTLIGKVNSINFTLKNQERYAKENLDKMEDSFNDFVTKIEESVTRPTININDISNVLVSSDTLKNNIMNMRSDFMAIYSILHSHQYETGYCDFKVNKERLIKFKEELNKEDNKEITADNLVTLKTKMDYLEKSFERFKGFVNLNPQCLKGYKIEFPEDERTRRLSTSSTEQVVSEASKSLI